ncbi:hypothetical protein IFM89_009996 [Coptis chinensis]|uniref:RING-type E3 ubiquitin transferase n=1 Tax=Coptis chinensis TaxID=261450 RepID=A0A835I0T5_9MAGN|nr:hypothetical protein IFM89_009996 [Coptis chinensis]
MATPSSSENNNTNSMDTESFDPLNMSKNTTPEARKYEDEDDEEDWLNHSNARNCKVCKHPFSFSPVYAENAPVRLPFQEFVFGIGMKACHILQFFLRLGFVLSVWLLIIPFITFWIWRLAFVRSFGEAHKLFLRHISTTVILTDCVHGFLLSASIVFIFLGATSLRDYFRHLRELGGQDGEREDEGVLAARRAATANNKVNADIGNGEDAIGGAGQLIRRNAENVAARLEMQAARLEAHVEQMFDGLDDADAPLVEADKDTNEDPKWGGTAAL